jgi:hypothetical protein
MPYARFDDRYDDHKKIKRAFRRQPAAVAMHAMAITYCNRHNTNGDVDADWIDEKLALMPGKPAQRERVLEVLLDLNLLERKDAETFIVHDFLDWNLSREQRAKLAEQGKRGGHARGRGSSPPDGQGSSQGQSQGLSKGSSQSGNGGSSTPSPLHATPTPRESLPTERDSNVVALCHRLADRIEANDARSNPKPNSDGWYRDMRLLYRDRGSATREIETVIDWCQADAFWQSNVLSPAKLRKQFTQLLLKAKPAGQVVPIKRDYSEYDKAAGLS